MRFSKDSKTLRARKAIRKLRTPYSGKLVFSYVEKGIKMKITAKFRDTEQLSFWKWGLCYPKSFGTFRKRAPGVGRSSSRGGEIVQPRDHGVIKGFAWYWGEFSESGKDEKIIESERRFTTANDLWHLSPDLSSISTDANYSVVLGRLISVSSEKEKNSEDNSLVQFRYKFKHFSGR